MQGYMRLFGLLVLLLWSPVSAQDVEKVDWEAAYQKLLESDPTVREKVESGNATKDQIIAWMKQVKGKGTQPGKKKESVKQGEDLSKLKLRLQTLVESGKLTQEDADKLLATMKGDGSKTQKPTAEVGKDWDSGILCKLSVPQGFPRPKIQRLASLGRQNTERVTSRSNI